MATLRLFPATSGPATSAADADNYTLGVEFYVTESANATAVFFWRPGTSPAITFSVAIYRVDSATSGTLLGSVTGVSAAANANGWHRVNLSSPVALVANQRYRAAVHSTTDNFYSTTSQYFNTGPGGSGVTNGSLVAVSGPDATNGAQGSFFAGSTLAFPRTGFNYTNYWIDVEVVTGSSTPQGGSTGGITRVGTATGEKDPLGSASSIIGWISAATGKLEPKGAATGSVSWVGFAVGQKVAGGSSSGSMTRVSSSATGVKITQGSVAGSISWVAVAVGKKEPEGSASGVFTHVGVATGSTPDGPAQGAAIGSIVWTGVASGRKVMGGAASGSVDRVGTASGERELSGQAAGAIAWVGIATGSQPGVLPVEGFAVGFIDWMGLATGKFSPAGSGVGSIDKTSAAQGKSIPLGSAVGLLEKQGVATGSKTSFFNLVLLSVTESTSGTVQVVEVPSYTISIQGSDMTVDVDEVTQEVTVEEVE